MTNLFRKISLLTALTLAFTSFSQELDSNARITFSTHPDQVFGLDSPQENAWNKLYERIYIDKNIPYQVPVKSIGTKGSDVVRVSLRNISLNENLVFKSDSLLSPLAYTIENDSTLSLYIPTRKDDYYIDAHANGALVGKLLVKVYKPIIQDVYLVTTTEKDIEIDSVASYLNQIFIQANIRFHFIDGIKYPIEKILDIKSFSNPSSAKDRYTEEMKMLRDQFFIDYPNLYRNAYVVFIIPGFVDPNVKGYMVKNKAMAFIKESDKREMYHEIAHQIGFGIGILDDVWVGSDAQMESTQNLMDTLGGTELTFEQWQKLRHSSNSYSFYDDDEDVKTNNGLVGYYFWSEDKDGNLIHTNNPLEGINRPYKKNHLSHHLNIKDFMFGMVYQDRYVRICWWHIAGWLVILIIGLIVKIRLKVRERLKNKLFLVSIFVKWTLRLSLAVICFLFYLFINEQLEKYTVTGGLIEDLNGMSYQEVKKSVLINESMRKKEQKDLSSEIFINKDNKWYLKRRERVLYFNSIYDSTTNVTSTKFTMSMDSLILRKYNYRDIAKSHYLVFSTYDLNGTLTDQKAYNHLGVEMTSKLEVQDAAKRILLFVNGYRPTSVGHTFEENFKDVLSNGFEFANSSNHIYTFDRYSYWRPWNQIDTKFINRLNPAETYYADGHFSVSTSNYGSLVNFSKSSTYYPDRCVDEKNHTCEYYTTNTKTLDLLPLTPNKRGFKVRQKNGEIAGKNLGMMFNEIPNISNNDTLYIVAHSMGYAYSLGIIEQLRGKINFGGFYILAPENASTGGVNLKEWHEVWQYGSNFEGSSMDAPCLQDGIAPQVCVKGLSEDYRAYIPKELYKRKGFFESHFVGYYSWIFKLEMQEKGFIKQR